MDNKPTLASADSKGLCTWTTDGHALDESEIAAGQQDHFLPQRRIKRDSTFRWSSLNSPAEGSCSIIVRGRHLCRIDWLLQQKPACHRRCGEEQQHYNDYAQRRLNTTAGTCLEERHLLPTRHTALGPCVRFLELRTTIQPIPGHAASLPLRNILADGLLQVNILTCLAQPLCKACPFADEGFVAHLNGGGSRNFIGHQQACGNEDIGDLAHNLRLLRIGEREFCQGSATTRGVLLGNPRVDQAQE